jgi:hypothetical protein
MSIKKPKPISVRGITRPSPAYREGARSGRCKAKAASANGETARNSAARSLPRGDRWERPARNAHPRVWVFTSAPPYVPRSARTPPRNPRRRAIDVRPNQRERLLFQANLLCLSANRSDEAGGCEREAEACLQPRPLRVQGAQLRVFDRGQADPGPSLTRAPDRRDRRGLKVRQAALLRGRGRAYTCSLRTESQSFLRCRDVRLTISRQQRSGHAAD